MDYADQAITTYGASPTDQRQRSMALVMTGFISWFYEFFTRPEDITYAYPTRATVIQTLGGAWVDDFGEGLTDITINGHTGWHCAPDLNGGLNSQDGMVKMHDLRYYCFEIYHAQRMLAAQLSQEPDAGATLFWIDTLHETAYEVYPLALQVRKHKSRPLLYQYQLRLIGLRKTIADADILDWTGQAGNWLTLAGTWL